jgi:hypothetical protein
MVRPTSVANPVAEHGSSIWGGREPQLSAGYPSYGQGLLDYGLEVNKVLRLGDTNQSVNVV